MRNIRIEVVNPNCKLVYINGKLTGHIINGTYLTPRTPEHYFKKFQSFGISKHLLKILEKAGVDEVIFSYKGKKNIWYSISLEDIKKVGFSYKHENYEEQIQIRTGFMKEVVK